MNDSTSPQNSSADGLNATDDHRILKKITELGSNSIDSNISLLLFGLEQYPATNVMDVFDDLRRRGIYKERTLPSAIIARQRKEAKECGEHYTIDPLLDIFSRVEQGIRKAESTARKRRFAADTLANRQEIIEIAGLIEKFLQNNRYIGKTEVLTALKIMVKGMDNEGADVPEDR